MRLSSCSELKIPCFKLFTAPSIIGISSKLIETSILSLANISSKWPARPKPVMSVQAVAFSLTKIDDASWFEIAIAFKAP